MYHKNRWMCLNILAAFAVFAVMLGCGGEGEAPLPEPEPPSTQPPEEQPASAKSRVKFRGGERYGNDLALALELTQSELCTELSNLPCTTVHKIALGGVDPYRARIDEPLPQESVTAPIAVERIALSACGERVTRDFADPDQAVLFAELAHGDVSESALRAVVDRLYDRIMRRGAAEWEIDTLSAWYGEWADSVEAEREWAQLACFVVATNTETLFY